MSSRAWSTQSTGDSRKYVDSVIKRPSQATLKKLFHARTPIRYFYWALHINEHTLIRAKRRIRELIIRHLDISKLYKDLPQSRLDFLKREILLDAELSFLMQYEDGWAVDVLVRNLYYQRYRLVKEKLKLIRNAKCDRRQRLFTSHSCVSPKLRLSARRTRTSTSSRVALLSTRLDSVTPSLLRFHPAIVQAGLCTDEHLHELFRMLPTSRDTFMSKALGTKKSTLFERVMVMDILEQMDNEQL
ncbi:hypothetical protein EDB19DRAFT_335822 [Suillus lakei]|nr:hypothetical protein EDB19DRAFT_335822 [Suillus lakei]